MPSGHTPLRRVTRRQAESSPAATQVSFLLSAGRELAGSVAATSSGQKSQECQSTDGTGDLMRQDLLESPDARSILGAELCRRALQVASKEGVPLSRPVLGGLCRLCASPLPTFPSSAYSSTIATVPLPRVVHLKPSQARRQRRKLAASWVQDPKQQYANRRRNTCVLERPCPLCRHVNRVYFFTSSAAWQAVGLNEPPLSAFQVTMLDARLAKQPAKSDVDATDVSDARKRSKAPVTDQQAKNADMMCRSKAEQQQSDGNEKAACSSKPGATVEVPEHPQSFHCANEDTCNARVVQNNALVSISPSNHGEIVRENATWQRQEEEEGNMDRVACLEEVEAGINDRGHQLGEQGPKEHGDAVSAEVLARLTVVELKQRLRSKKLPVSGLKAILVQRLIDASKMLEAETNDVAGRLGTNENIHKEGCGGLISEDELPAQESTKCSPASDLKGNATGLSLPVTIGDSSNQSHDEAKSPPVISDACIPKVSKSSTKAKLEVSVKETRRDEETYGGPHVENEKSGEASSHAKADSGPSENVDAFTSQKYAVDGKDNDDKQDQEYVGTYGRGDAIEVGGSPVEEGPAQPSCIGVEEQQGGEGTAEFEGTMKGASHMLMSEGATEQVPEPHLSPDVVATELVQHQEPSVAAELPNIHSTYNDSNSAGSEEDRECAGKEDENDDFQEVEGDSLAFVSQDIEQDAERNMEDFCSRHIESTVKGASHILMSKRAAEQVPEPHLSPDVVATELVQHQEPSVATELPNIHSTYNDSNSAGSEEDRECAGKEDENDDFQEVEGDSLAFVSQDIEQDAEGHVDDIAEGTCRQKGHQQYHESHLGKRQTPGSDDNGRSAKAQRSSYRSMRWNTVGRGWQRIGRAWHHPALGRKRCFDGQFNDANERNTAAGDTASEEDKSCIPGEQAYCDMDSQSSKECSTVRKPAEISLLSAQLRSEASNEALQDMQAADMTGNGLVQQMQESQSHPQDSKKSLGQDDEVPAHSGAPSRRLSTQIFLGGVPPHQKMILIRLLTANRRRQTMLRHVMTFLEQKERRMILRRQGGARA